MEILLNNNNEVIAYASIGGIEGAIKIEEEIIDFEPYKYKYAGGEIKENENYINIKAAELEMQLMQRERAILKQLLSSTDNKIIEHLEGLISDEEYEYIKAERQAYRDRLAEIENGGENND